MKITIRIDDITANMDWPKFLKFKGLLDVYGIKPLIGVIPDNMDTSLDGNLDGAPENFWEYVKELKNDGYVISMHGMSHVYTTSKPGLFPLNKFSEFAGLSYDEQLELLSYGVDIFNEHELDTDIFMAPGHSFDRNTLMALKELGFTKITDGFGNRPYVYDGITFYPISANRKTVLKNKSKKGFTTFVYHINTMNDADFDSFEKLLKEYEVVSYSEYLKLTPTKRGALGHFKEKLMADTKRVLVSLR